MPSESVADIYEDIREDPLFEHLRTAHIRLVPGIGSQSATYLLVGEAPGATENTKGRPFCGASGRVLDQLMGVAGISVTETIGQDGIRRDANAWLTNVVKYRPPGNRTPTLGGRWEVPTPSSSSARLPRMPSRRSLVRWGRW